MNRILDIIGRSTIDLLHKIGRITILLVSAVLWSVRRPFRIKNLFKQLEFVGVKSSFIIILTGTFTGAVFALQISHAVSLVNLERMVGATVVISLARELGPVLTALLVTGRAGSAMAAEIGTMRVTEQIDALHTMAVNPIHYLVVSRVIASIIMVPCLTLLFNFMGTMGSYFVGVKLLLINAREFVDEIIYLVDLDDFYNGLFKAACFGLILSIISCYKGYYAEGGAEGVGRATTEAVVYSSVSILVSDYYLTAWLF